MKVERKNEKQGKMHDNEFIMRQYICLKTTKISFVFKMLKLYLYAIIAKL